MNGVTFFAPQLFVGVSTLGTGNEGWLIAAVIVNGVQLLATFITVITVDRLGRRMLLLTGSTFGFVTEMLLSSRFLLQRALRLCICPMEHLLPPL